MKYCIHCGTQLPAEAHFCSACGKSQKETNGLKHAQTSQPAPKTQPYVQNTYAPVQRSGDALGKVAHAFMIVTDVIWGIMAFYSLFMILGFVGAFGGLFYLSGPFYLYAIMLCAPLFWCIPMTVVLSRKMKSNQPVGVGFKVCTLIFVNLISGILLLCRKEQQ